MSSLCLLATKNGDAILQEIPEWEAAAECSDETASGVNADAAAARAKPEGRRSPTKRLCRRPEKRRDRRGSAKVGKAKCAARRCDAAINDVESRLRQ
jgi:hypothetical protein